MLDVVLQNTADNQTITASVPFPIVAFDFDPEIHLISNNNSTTLGNQDFAMQSIQLYPNPASAVLNISLPSSVTVTRANVYNAIGQLVLSTDNTEINVEALSSGVHFIKVETSEGTFTKKFVKK